MAIGTVSKKFDYQKNYEKKTRKRARKKIMECCTRKIFYIYLKLSKPK